jgi:pyruvate-formate lyase-activating enzyme
MLGDHLKLNMVRTLLDDAAADEMTTARLYGGEPLVHPDLAEMMQHANAVGIFPYITTNGFLLDRKIDKLYAAGCALQRLDTTAGDLLTMSIRPEPVRSSTSARGIQPFEPAAARISRCS